MKKETTMTWDKLPENIRKAVVANELLSLKPDERLLLYREICEQKGLDPSTRPFEFLMLNGKLTMYARKECADQLRERNGISAEILTSRIDGPVYFVHVRAKNAEGRTEDDIGVTSISEPEFLTRKDKTRYENPRHGKQMEGDEVANAMMKAVTKAKRRCTLAICGLGMYDESELETIPESSIGKAMTVEEVEDVARRVRELKEAAVKGPKKDKERLMREACELEAQILDLPGSGHTPEDQKQPAQNGTPAKQEPAPAASTPAKAAEEPKTQEAPKIEKAAQEPAKPVKQEEPAPAKQPAASAPAVSVEDWENHVIKSIKNRHFENIKVSDISLANLKVVYLNWIVKFKDSISKVPEKSLDAAAILAALQEQAPEFLQENPL